MSPSTSSNNAANTLAGADTAQERHHENAMKRESTQCLLCVGSDHHAVERRQVEPIDVIV
eukprot:CAMPEP_0198562864 /NCGR_PEP_ID=MMETSP1462-20131121/97833_1 /TAXON_ID=1333877 /ORGANISM="Brandtodinium nutriculum, Strain RCC3387" /LENGTH=59 /DNA_ID=CAMNT_0044293801 /DNA_START=111 /DNA_END=291 /DNA_ORIENTATION=+